MVRLKDNENNAGHIFVSLFQFHYGTIKSRDKSKPLRLDLLHFNSTMVRLKEKQMLLIGKLRKISIPLWYD